MSSWRLRVSFIDRFQHIANISSALHERARLERSLIQERAKTTETSFYETASSLEEYNELCRGATIQHTQETPLHDDCRQSHIDEPLSPVAIQIGHYRHAIHYRNGIFSEVYRAPAPTHLSHSAAGDVALKVTTPSMMIAPHDARKEGRILRYLHGRNDRVISLIESFSLAGDRFVLVFPFMPFSLDSILAETSLTTEKVKSHLRDLFSALAFLHDNGVIHRDIKPSNLLLHSPAGPALLSDFGISWSANDEASEPADQKITDVGTTCYRPPEILFGKKDYDSSLDMWAAGCVMAEATALRSKTLFESGNVGTELALIQSIFMTLGTPDESIWPNAKSCPDWGKMQWKNFPTKPWPELLPKASSSAQHLVAGLVRYEPTQRLSAAAAFRHEYFNEDES